MGTGFPFGLGRLALAIPDQLDRRHAGLSGTVVGLFHAHQGGQKLIIRCRAVGLLGQEHQKLLGFGAGLQVLERRHPAAVATRRGSCRFSPLCVEAIILAGMASPAAFISLATSSRDARVGVC
jgi:hypothetical protein